MTKTYNKTFRLKVAKEALLPENKNMEHIIAKKYGLRPSTVIRWTEAYLQFGESAFAKGGYKLHHQPTEREKQLEQENKQLREEVEILKKAAAFLADLRRE